MMIRKLMRGNRSILIPNLRQMEQFAGVFAMQLAPGDFIALTGTLGTGKTTFTRMLCEKLGVTQPVTSPTFTLLNEYATQDLLILHGDFYRLTPAEIAQNLPELESYLDETAARAATLMEWADLAPELDYRWTWHLHFSNIADTPDNEESRRVEIHTDKPDDLDTLEAAFSNVA